MANEIRARFNNVSGTLSAELAAGATSMSSAGLANLGVIDSTNHCAITIESEIVKVTAHTAAATTATIVRAQEGTNDVTHASGAEWNHAPTAHIDDYRPQWHRVLAANQLTGATTLQDTNLKFFVPPNKSYLFHISAVFDSEVSQSGPKIGFSGPSGATLFSTGAGHSGETFLDFFSATETAFDTATAVDFGGDTANNGPIQIWGVITTGGTGGAVTFKFQATTLNNDNTLLAGSSLSAWEAEAV